MLMVQDIQVVAIFLNNNYEMIQEGLILAKLSPQIKNQVECKIVIPCLANQAIKQLVLIAIDRSAIADDI